jgi:hypothetical protein
MTRKTFALIACCLISPAIAAAQTGGLTKVQLLALQQELKEQCGLAHATGVMDGPTRHAIAVCNKKYGTQGNGAALLAAMNVGFGTGENEPQGGMGSVMGNDKTTVTETTTTTVTTKPRTTRGTKTRTRARGNAGGTNRGDMDSDAYKKGVDSTSGGVDVDARTNDRKMARDSAEAGRRDGRVRNPGKGKPTKYGKDSLSN